MADNIYFTDDEKGLSSLKPLIVDEGGYKQDNNGEKRQYVVYGYRWIVLMVFVLSGIANAMVLLTWAPITDKAQTYWNSINITWVNLLSVIFQICYVPGTMIALWVSERQKLRGLLLRGGLLTCVGCVIRTIGALVRDSAGSGLSYALILIGTFFVGLAQPFYLNMPAKIATTWFGVNERDIATTLCSLSNPLGSALGSLIPAMFVNSDSYHEIQNGVRYLLIVQMAVAIAALVLSFALLKSEPPTPASAAAEHMQIIKSTKGMNTMFGDIQKLLNNWEYSKLLFSFTIVLGSLNALATLLNQLPGGFSNSEVGLCGAILIMSGFFGAFITGFILDYSKSYKAVLKTAYVLTLLSWTFFMSNCRSKNVALFIVSAALLGGSTLPTSKFCYEVSQFSISSILFFSFSSCNHCHGS
jgi:MFS family permease